MVSRRLQRALTIGLLAIAGVVVVVAPGGADAVFHFPLDDGWIHQVYARSLARTGELAYNPGQLETGFTSPLWVLASTPLHWLLLEPARLAVGAKLLSLIFLWLAALAGGRLADRLSGGDRGAFWIGAIAVAVSPSLLFSGAAAMEVTLAAWLLVELTLAALDAHSGRLAATAALAVLARPESLVAVAFVAAWVALEDRPGGKGRRLAAIVTPAMAVAAAWSGYCVSVSGYLLPNTYYAKTTNPDFLVGLRYWAADVLVVEYWVRSVVGPALVLTGVVLSRSRRAAILVLGVALSMSLAIAAGHDLVPGVGFYMQRYFYPVLPLFLVMGAVGALSAFRYLGVRLAQPEPPIRPGLARLLAATCAAALLVSWGLDLIDRSGTYGSNCRVIRQLHVEPALALSHLNAGDGPVAAEAAGATRYFSGLETIDLLGLNHAAIAHLTTDPNARRCLFAQLDPRYFIIPGAWITALEPTFEMRPIAAVRTTRDTIWRRPRTRTVVTLTARLREGALAGCR